MGQPVRFLVIAFLLLLAAPVRAQDELDGRFKPTSEVLGAGDYKGVFGVEGRPDLVIAIAKYDDANSTFMKEKFAREKADLERLEKAGAYVARIEAIGTYEGKAALVMKRYATGTKASEWSEARWSLLNETSILELRKIERALLRSGLEVQDLQFLVDKDGHVVVADPEEVGEKVRSPSDVKRSIAALISQAEEAIRWRRIARVLAAMPDAKDARFRDFFAKRELVPSWNDPAANKKITDALLDYLKTGATTETAKAVAAAVETGRVAIVTEGRWEGYAKNEVHLPIAGSFPRLAADLVRRVFDHLSGSGGAKHAAELLAKKGVPAELGAELERTAQPIGTRAFERLGEGGVPSTRGILDKLVERRVVEARDRVR